MCGAHPLGGAANATAETDAFPGECCRRFLERGRELVAVAPARILVIVWHLLADPVPASAGLGPDHHVIRRRDERTIGNHAAPTRRA
ncbi:hypothetical protein [Rhodococcus sp. NPDC057529]|uniref:hypothetical protein n=1 Tax=Rhodococcus sp. NPDC057529 TaxID=3346158 RepID=UPI00366E7742